MGHALIDIEGIPIFAQEEDAADVFSIYMIDSVFEEETAVALAYDAAFGFLGEAEARQQETDEIPCGIHTDPMSNVSTIPFVFSTCGS